jgi:hypothetical protein
MFKDRIDPLMEKAGYLKWMKKQSYQD